MLIAIASTDGVHVNEHFGRVGRFLIYDAAPEGLRFVEERRCEPLSVNDPDHPFDPRRFEQVFSAVEGCGKVYVVQIGARPAEELRMRGVEPVVYEGGIASISGDRPE